MTKYHAHELVAKTAREMAGEAYQDLMRDNKIYKHWQTICPDLTPEWLEARFIAMATPHFLEPARTTLAQLLTTNIAEGLKADIVDALIKDNQLRRGRARLQTVATN